MSYPFHEIETKWQKYWEDHQTYKVTEDPSFPKEKRAYVLDMFPYPSGAGLHVGHPEGYTATDIYSRYLRMNGYNVLHPMGFDSFGLPAENYAIKTGTHPKTTTLKNIATFTRQIKSLGFSYDWSREISTCEPEYYKWTQWIFLQLYKKGLAYETQSPINWCPSCKTGLANEEVKEGKCERCGTEVVRKNIRQWVLKITAYADELLKDLDGLDWPESVKLMQRNWIGRSTGASVQFQIDGSDKKLEVYTTRCDTLFGVTYMVVSPEHPLLKELTTDGQRAMVEAYVDQAAHKSDLERTDLAKVKTGVFTGSYAINPLNGKKVPVWVGDYVLISYGTGAIMAVPAHDERDWEFAKKYHLPIVEVLKSDVDVQQQAWTQDGIHVNSDWLDGLNKHDAIEKVLAYLEEHHIGHRTVNFKLRDWIFSRQRYWGEPFPIYYKDNTPYPIPEECLPLELPEVSEFKPTATGEPPLGHAQKWAWDEPNRCVTDKSRIDNKTVFPLELSTMPGFAGSSGYYLRYMDPRNDKAYFGKEAVNYWQKVDLYVGGAEHASGHLIYSRFWNKFLHDIGMSVVEEPFQKLINQGMIQGRSNFVYRSKTDNNLFISKGLIKDMDDVTPIHVDINIVDNDVLDIERFRQWRPEFADARFEMEEDKYICGWEVEKMSKSMFNVQNPDDLVARYGADTLRLYEMFLGPVEQAKPWDTNGIEGVHRFLKKFWKLYDTAEIKDATDLKAELKILHQTIKKITDDIERFSFNTAVSTFMICTNQLTDLKCSSREVLEPLVVLLAPFAPHIAEELWHRIGNDTTVCDAQWPVCDEKYLVEDTVKYPVQFNGKMRFMLDLPATCTQEEAVAAVKAAPEAAKWLTGEPKKVIFVPKKIINVVV